MAANDLKTRSNDTGIFNNGQSRRATLYVRDEEVTATGSELSNVSQTTRTQSGHGFPVRSILYNDGSIFKLAKADDADTANALGVVTEVIDANNFVLTFAGFKSIFTGLTPGETYFLSETTAGEFTVTQPTAPNIVKPMFNAISATEAYIFTSTGFQALV